MKNQKKTTFALLALILTVAFASLAPSAGVMAAKKNGLVKSSGKWYYYKSGKKQTGLQKVNGKVYYFNGKGVMVSGFQRDIKGYSYYFNKITKAGKTKGQAPALVNKEKKIGGYKYYFASDGKGFFSVGNAKGNKAVAQVVTKAGFKKGMETPGKIEKCYRYIIKKYTYFGLADPDLSKKSWIFDAASAFNNKMTTVNGVEMGGKCYNYAAMTYLCCIASGGDKNAAAVVVGKDMGNNGNVHAWVELTPEPGHTSVVDTLIGDLNPDKNCYMVSYDYMKDTVGHELAEESRYPR